MRVLNLLPKGNPGGIESLCLNIAKFSEDEHYFYFMWSGGIIADEIMGITDNVIIRNFRYQHIVSEFEALKKYVIFNDIDIILIHVPSPVFLFFVERIKQQLESIKICVYIHADPAIIFTNTVHKLMFMNFCKNVDGCIATSSFVKGELSKYNIKSDIIKRIYNGVCLAEVSSDERQLIRHYNDMVQFIYVGRLSKEKGVDILINALASIEQRFELLVVGDGPQRLELENMVKARKLTDKVTFTGFSRDVSSHIGKSDILILPSRCQEGFGITLIEAMGVGVPCIAFSRGAIPEIITDGEDGFIVDEVSVEALANKISEIMNMFIDKQDELNIIKNKARLRAQDFTINKYVNELGTYLKML